MFFSLQPDLNLWPNKVIGARPYTKECAFSQYCLVRWHGSMRLMYFCKHIAICGNNHTSFNVRQMNNSVPFNTCCHFSSVFFMGVWVVWTSLPMLSHDTKSVMSYGELELIVLYEAYQMNSTIIDGYLIGSHSPHCLPTFRMYLTIYKYQHINTRHIVRWQSMAMHN